MDVLALLNGRLIKLLRIEPYRRKDGTASAVAVWQATCKACGAAFEIATPSNLQSVVAGKAFTVVNCHNHRPRRKKATGQRNEASDEAR